VGGKTVGVVLVFRDITECKKAEEALQKAYADLEQRVQERTFELSEAYETLQKEVVERKKAEDQLIRVQKLEALGTLAGGIAHDFNNILQALSVLPPWSWRIQILTVQSTKDWGCC
jgi:C4-dicarboxylate-specific signal transduction histidine kinase